MIWLVGIAGYLAGVLWLTRRMYVKGIRDGEMFGHPIEEHERSSFLGCMAFIGLFWPLTGLIDLVWWWMNAPIRKMQRREAEAKRQHEERKAEVKRLAEKYLELGLASQDYDEKMILMNAHADYVRELGEMT